MHLAVVSDIHANLQAWNAVLLDARSVDVDAFLCLGDIVGYGPNPAEVLSSVHSNVQHIVLGNHDAVVCGKLTPELFHESAAQIIRWTRSRLNNKAVNFLGSLPLSIDCDHFRCSHGDISDPAAFNYVSEAQDAVASWTAHEGSLFLVGHTHEPAIFILGESGLPRSVEPQDFVIEEGKRFIVNPGSVGQPRDGLALASYCIYEMETRSIFWRRVPFDIDEYMKSVVAEGLDESVNCFTSSDPRNNAVAARQYTDFSPPRYKADKAKGVVQVKEVRQIERSARRWRKSFTAASLVLLLLLTTLITAGFLNATRQMTIPASLNSQCRTPVLASLSIGDKPFLPLSDFTVCLGNRRRQSIEVIDPDPNEAALLRIASSSEEAVTLETPDIPVQPGNHITLAALVRKGEDFKGNVCAYISKSLKTSDRLQRTPRFLVKEPNMKRKNDFILAKQTFEVPANTSCISLGLELNFQGTVEIAELSLTTKE